MRTPVDVVGLKLYFEIINNLLSRATFKSDEKSNVVSCNGL